MPGSIGETTECRAVTAGQVVCDRDRCVVSVGEMRDRVQREGEQQATEGDSQPLRRSSGEQEGAH